MKKNGKLLEKTLKKIDRIFPIYRNDKIFIPIIEEITILKQLLKRHKADFLISVPTHTFSSHIPYFPFISEQKTQGRLRIIHDFFGLTHNYKDDKFTKILIFFPRTLANKLILFALNQLRSLNLGSIPILMIFFNLKQTSVAINWLVNNGINFEKMKRQKISFIKIIYLKQLISNSEQSKSQDDFTGCINTIRYEKTFGTFTFASSNGVFSKNKVDSATDFLIETVVEKSLVPEQSVLVDYFSGIGVIGITIAKLLPLSKLYFIESDIISIHLLERNLKSHKFEKYRIIGMDGLKPPPITPHSIDIILANPPTHIKKESYINFFKISRELLKPDGNLLIVINSIMPYESLLRNIFGNSKDLTVFRKGKFKILMI